MNGIKMIRRSYTMTKDARNQRIKYGFKKDMRYSGIWTMVRMRKEMRDGLKKKYGTLQKAFEFALSAS